MAISRWKSSSVFVIVSRRRRVLPGGDQHLVTVLGIVDAYQNTGIRVMLELGHSRSPLWWVVRKATIET